MISGARFRYWLTHEPASWSLLLLRFFLLLISIPYGGIVALRNWAYDKRWLKTYRPRCHVISVGNIVLGGTGKTPVTLMLAQELSSKGQVAILTRGYRSLAEKENEPTLLWLARGKDQSASFCGDEPVLLARHLPEVQVWVGHNRSLSAQRAVEHGAKILILDDGMQHRQLARDYEVVVVDAGDPLGQAHIFPRGFLREPLRGLTRADCIVVTHADTEEDLKRTIERIKPYSQAPVLHAKMVITKFCDMGGNIIDLRGQKVGLFCGIAQPHYFRRDVESMGVSVVAVLESEDHKIPSYEKLALFADQCRKQEATWLVCTEKDKVKLPSNLNLSLPVAWSCAELHV